MVQAPERPVEAGGGTPGQTGVCAGLMPKARWTPYGPGSPGPPPPPPTPPVHLCCIYEAVLTDCPNVKVFVVASIADVFAIKV